MGIERPSKQYKRGFTLIELLVVVSVIAVLALIALPNLLEAQTRAKVSRAKADMRTMVAAIEMYRTDWNKPAPHPIPGLTDLQGTPFQYMVGVAGFSGTGTLTCAITTPIAYLTTFQFYDPFANTDPTIPVDEQLYTYHAYQWKWREIHPPLLVTRDDGTSEPGNEQMLGHEFRELYGEYRVLSIGPDRNYYNKERGSGEPYPIGNPYDGTNGTVSIGNIIRSEKHATQQAYKIVE